MPVASTPIADLPADARRLLDRIVKLSEDIRAHERALSIMYESRVQMYREGIAAGLTRVHLGEAAGTTDVAVAKALRPPKA